METQLLSYADFRLSDVIEKFNLVTREGGDLFADRPLLEPTPILVELLRHQVPLAVAISNEKVRSELIVAPVLVELQRSRSKEISFFSGVELPVDPSNGLTGTCDFLLSLSPEQTYVKAPVVTLVEAKRGDVPLGLGQCAAEMVGGVALQREGWQRHRYGLRGRHLRHDLDVHEPLGLNAVDRLPRVLHS